MSTGLHDFVTNLLQFGTGTDHVSLAEKIVRPIVVYLLLVVTLKLIGRRVLAQFSAFDFVVLLLISNTVQNAIIGNDNSLLGGVVGAGFLLLINALLVRTLYHYGKLDTIEGRPDILIRNGRILRHHLERELITVAELEASARRQGLASLAEVKECRIESGGALTFVQRHPTEDERRHHDILAIVSQVEARQNSILEQLAALDRKIAGTPDTRP